MHPSIPLAVGAEYGFWTVLEDLGPLPYGKTTKRFSRCICKCGTEGKVSNAFLKNGHSQSCGCLMRKRTSDANSTHGETGARRSHEYVIWTNIIQRCTNPKVRSYHRYGGRGIVVCDRWKSFENFLADVGRAPKGLTLDRRDNDKGYGPDNFRWATYKEQANNRSYKKDRKNGI